MRYAGGHRHPERGNWLYQNQTRPVYHIIDGNLPLIDIHVFKSKKCASVSEEFVLFNWSSVGYMRSTILSIFNKLSRCL